MLIIPAEQLSARQIQTDTTTSIQVRPVPEALLDSLTRSGDFSYQNAEEPETLWERIQRWIFQNIFQMLQNDWVRVFFKIAFFAIFAVILIGLINQILGGNITGAFVSGTKDTPGVSAAEVIHPEERDLDALLKTALDENRYQDAVKLQYLIALRLLNRNAQIHWRSDKTNHDYLQEIEDPELRQLFSRLTRYFEYAEYGNFPVQEKTYRNAGEAFGHLFEKVGRNGS